VIGQRAGPASDCLAWTLHQLGHAAQLYGAYERAAQLHQESLAHFTTSDYPTRPPTAYHGLGVAALGLGNSDAAARWFAQRLALSQTESNLASLAWCLAGIGSSAALDEAPEPAARLWAAAEQLQQVIGCRSAPSHLRDLREGAGSGAQPAWRRCLCGGLGSGSVNAA